MTNTPVDLLGAAAMTADGAGSDEPASIWLSRFYFAPGLRLGGGTDEIQRNTIAECVLGLPREPR
jgi:alkylation response protein AidB-like acyl-CoA dehydrogenase